MRVSTSKYEWAHGKKPRGHGYWMFFEDNNLGADRDRWNISRVGTYSKAKEQAIILAKLSGITSLRVGE